MKRIFKFMIPFLLLASGIFFIFAFEFYIKDRVNTVPVVVAASEISFKEPFSLDNLEITHMKREYMVKDAYVHESSLHELVGQVAAVDISAGTQLYPALIDTFDLVPDHEAGEFIAPIPNEWIFAVPGSLRRSYLADFYAVSNDQSGLMREWLKQEQTVFIAEEPGASIERDEQPPLLLELEHEPILENIKVIYTKDSSNREVQTLQDTQLDGTANISNLEIIANQETLNQLKHYANQGYTFYITYKLNR